MSSNLFGLIASVKQVYNAQVSESVKQGVNKMVRKLKYVGGFGVLFGIVAMLSFLGGLMINMQYAPTALSEALQELAQMAPVMAIGGIIFGWIQGFLLLWLYKNHCKWALVASVITAVLLGGAVSFFSMWLIWAITTLLNLVMVWALLKTYGCECVKH